MTEALEELTAEAMELSCRHALCIILTTGVIPDSANQDNLNFRPTESSAPSLLARGQKALVGWDSPSWNNRDVLPGQEAVCHVFPYLLIGSQSDGSLSFAQIYSIVELSNSFMKLISTVGGSHMSNGHVFSYFF